MAKVTLYALIYCINNLTFVYVLGQAINIKWPFIKEGIFTALLVTWGIIKIMDAYKQMRKK